MKNEHTTHFACTKMGEREDMQCCYCTQHDCGKEEKRPLRIVSSSYTTQDALDTEKRYRKMVYAELREKVEELGKIKFGDHSDYDSGFYHGIKLVLKLLE